MSHIKDIGEQILGALFPPVCIACHHVEGATTLPLGLCSVCRSRLRTLTGRACRNRGVVDGCLDAAVSRWLYQPPFDVVIHAFKFGRLEFLGSDLAAGLQLNLQESSQEIDVIVPIPLHWLRLRTRGFNQAEAIARPLALSLGRPLVKALRRRRSTKAQTLLTRGQRHQNLRLAFAQVRRQRHRIEGRRVLLVDDVVTTGATLESAARCLIELGAAAVIGATAGRTPGSRIETPTRERDGRLWRNSLTRKP